VRRRLKGDLKHMDENNPKQIVILGAGVAGLRVALKLEKRISRELARIILIDENEYHQYLYRIQEVCNSDYEERDIVVPISRLIKGKRIEFVKTTVKTVDPNRHIVETIEGEQPFDILVIALGSHVAYFGIEGLEENSLTLNSFEAAKNIRAKIEFLFDKAGKSGQPPNIVIGGGGFTGVELAGELTDWIPILCKTHGLEPSDHLLFLVEAMPTILPGWNPDQVRKAQEVLSERGVNLILDDPILKVSEKRISLRSGMVLKPDLFIWSGGVRGDPACGVNFDIKSRRIVIDDYCRAKGFEDIYVAGDAACTIDGKTGIPMPPTAHIAMEQGDIVAHNIQASLREGEMKKYVFNRVGEIVTLGRTNAVGELFGIKFTGSTAKFMKKVVHWWYLHSIGGFSLLLGS
jgi:NADH dehydrogenase